MRDFRSRMIFLCQYTLGVFVFQIANRPSTTLKRLIIELRKCVHVYICTCTFLHLVCCVGRTRGDAGTLCSKSTGPCVVFKHNSFELTDYWCHYPWNNLCLAVRKLHNDLPSSRDGSKRRAEGNGLSLLGPKGRPLRFQAPKVPDISETLGTDSECYVDQNARERSFEAEIFHLEPPLIWNQLRLAYHWAPHLNIDPS